MTILFACRHQLRDQRRICQTWQQADKFAETHGYGCSRLWNATRQKWQEHDNEASCAIAETFRRSYAAVEVATRAAKCEQCGQSISKGTLRLAKNILSKGKARFPTHVAATPVGPFLATRLLISF